MKKIEFLREKYPRFIYQKYYHKISNNNLEIFFDFKIEPDPAPAPPFSKRAGRYRESLFFKPKIVIENVKKSQIDRLGKRVLNNLVFHLGLIEIPSYWKATCSPIIEIRAGYLNSEQIRWWKNLIIKGMGQFFYENKIDFTQPSFLKIKNFQGTTLSGLPPVKFNIRRKSKRNKFLVPIGGGKDSIVTLEKLKEKGEKIGCFLVNPTRAMREIVKMAKIKPRPTHHQNLVRGVRGMDSVIVRREIDPALLELNKRGFLNGHTPFTAVLSFLSVFCAVLFDYRNIAFSNEKSADEGNLRYLGRIINHQWSKSSEFEKKFQGYCQKYLINGINYFSFLRKYTELDISKIFTKYPQYFSVFSSCNVVLAKKLKKRWCGNCAKCLFVYASLYPFLEKEKLLKIFGRDIFQNKALLPTMCDLLGPSCPPKLREQRRRSHKPFECVGTFKESKMAFQMSFQKAKKEGKIPFLLKKLYFEEFEV